MIFDGHGDVWTDVTCRAVDHGERDIFRKHHLHKFQEGGVTGGIFVIWIDPPYDSDPVKRSKQIVKSIKQEMEDSADILNFVKKYDDFEKGTKEVEIEVLKNENYETKVIYNVESQTLTVDRSNSMSAEKAPADHSQNGTWFKFLYPYSAPVPMKDGKVSLHIFVDNYSQIIF